MTDVSTDASWQGVYRAGAVVAVLAIACLLFDIVLANLPGWGPETAPKSVAEWFAQLASHPLLGVRNLDLLNITVALFSLPMYLALYGAHRRAEPALALLALLLVSLGTALFVANNAALPMLGLSRAYASAEAAERVVLEGAGAALLAGGAHGSFGAFTGFFLCEVGTLLMALAMLRGGVFRRAAGWLGVIGASALIVYSLVLTFAPGAQKLVLALVAPGGLLMLVWHGMVARTLFRLGAAKPRVEAAGAAP